MHVIKHFVMHSAIIIMHADINHQVHVIIFLLSDTYLGNSISEL